MNLANFGVGNQPNTTNTGLGSFGLPANYSPVSTTSIVDSITNGANSNFNLGDIGTSLPATNQNGGGGILGTFRNADGSLNLGNIGQGIGTIGDIFGAYMALKQFGMAQDAFELDQKITRDNHNNNIALAQNRLDDRTRRRELDNAHSNAAAAAAGQSGPVSAPVLRNSLGGG